MDALIKNECLVNETKVVKYVFLDHSGVSRDRVGGGRS